MVCRKSLGFVGHLCVRHRLIEHFVVLVVPGWPNSRRRRRRQAPWKTFRTPDDVRSSSEAYLRDDEEALGGTKEGQGINLAQSLSSSRSAEMSAFSIDRTIFQTFVQDSGPAPDADITDIGKAGSNPWGVLRIEGKMLQATRE